MKTVIENFTPLGGKHCITNSLKQIFCFYGYPISEEMLFGLASGLSFLYINQSQSPMINGRIKVFEFEKKLAKRLNINIQCKSGKEPSMIFERTKKLINEQHPVLIYVDMPYLKYLGLPEDSHFGGHAVVLYGYDESTKKFWVSDRDQHDAPIRVPNGEMNDDYHLVDFNEIERARSSTHRPFPAHNKYLVFNFHGYRPIDSSILLEAIKETCDQMLYPPAQLFGINGMKKFAKEILKWKRFDKNKLQQAGVTNYFQISKDGGTGGGIFRKMYGEFLIESSTMFKGKQMRTIGEGFLAVSKQWDEIADDLWQLSMYGDESLLAKISGKIMHIYEQEKGLYLALIEFTNNEMTSCSKNA